MALHHVIGAEDRATFLDCRRAWDLSARERRNLEPVLSGEPVDVERAIRDALAVYYFPGMWDWQPSVVLPLVRRAFTDSVAAQRARYLKTYELAALPPDQERTADERARLGLELLETYVSWAPTVDEFAPIQVLAEIDVQVPDPRSAERELAVGSRAVRYRDRIDILAMDADHRYWLIEHRFVTDAWPDVEAVQRDDRCLSWCWAWEYDNPGLHVQGTIYNELRIDDVAGADPTTPPPGPRSPVAQHHSEISPLGPSATEYELRIRFGDRFRRLEVPRRPAEIDACGRRLAEQLADMIDDGLSLYPNPSTARCERCAFRSPCLSLDVDGDAAALLAASYRPREHEVRGGTLGGRTWSMGRGAVPPSS